MNPPAPDAVTAYIGLGSNLQDPIGQLLQARQAIAATTHVSELAFSGLYRNPPMGPADQPDYVNAVMAVSTSLPAQALLKALQAIENQQGRQRNGERWGPRTLDLDILLYGQEQIRTPDLTVPHPGVAERAFVLLPLLEIAADLEIPGYGSVRNLAARHAANALVRIDSAPADLNSCS